MGAGNLGREMKASIALGLKAELNRLIAIRKDFETFDEWMEETKRVFRTLKQFNLIEDWRLNVNEQGVSLDVQAYKECYETVSAYRKH